MQLDKTKKEPSRHSIWGSVPTSLPFPVLSIMTYIDYIYFHRPLPFLCVATVSMGSQLPATSEGCVPFLRRGPAPWLNALCLTVGILEAIGLFF